jgi:hypothetical protein
MLTNRTHRIGAARWSTGPNSSPENYRAAPNLHFVGSISMSRLEMLFDWTIYNVFLLELNPIAL